MDQSKDWGQQSYLCAALKSSPKLLIMYNGNGMICFYQTNYIWQTVIDHYEASKKVNKT